jgi:hypothetical protein
MKHRYLSTVAGAALVLSVALAPVATLANSGQSSAHPGFFSGIFSWFEHGAKTAHADDKDATTTPRNTPPSISGISAPTVLAVGATGTWTVSASDRENGNLSYSVDWGDQKPEPLARAALTADAFVQTSTFTHAYDTAGTYTVKFTVKDDAGLTAKSSATVHVNRSATSAPVISSVSAKATNSTHALISWKTDVRADASVYYGTSTPLNLSTALSAKGAGQVENHLVTLNKLTASTTYYFVVKSKGVNGQVATSSESSFTTPAAPVDGTPTISSVTGPQTLAVDTEGTWTVTASDPQNDQLSYSIKWGDESFLGKLFAFVMPPKVFTQTSTFTHTYANAGDYTITVTAKDGKGHSTTSSTTVTVTASSTTAPTISGVTALVADDSITLNWKTDVAADSTVYYSTTSPVTTSSASTTDASLVTSHSLSVGSLSSGTTYHFLLESKNSDGATASTTEFSLMTLSL